jgi:hypothetical protein
MWGKHNIVSRIFLAAQESKRSTKQIDDIVTNTFCKCKLNYVEYVYTHVSHLHQV